MDVVMLRRENRAFRGTRGISQNCCSEFRPAFLDKRTGQIEVARFEDGRPAPVHVISYLPREWAISIDTNGAVLRLRSGIISGFVRDDVFYTREEIAGL